MPPDGASFIEECTRGTTKASLYRSRLGLLESFQDSTKPGRPGFSTNPAIKKFWATTIQPVHDIAALYKSRGAIREALTNQRIALDETVNECLEEAGPQIWNKGVDTPFVTTLTITAKINEQSDAGNASKGKDASRATGNPYLRHLIYENPEDRESIRLHVFGYIIQRACRKAEDDRREEKYLQDPSTATRVAPSGFVEAVHIEDSRSVRGTTISSDSSLDPLNPEYPTGPSTSPKHKGHTNAQGSNTSADTKHASTQRRHKHRVCVVIPRRKPAGTGATSMASRKREQSQSLDNSDTVVRSTQNNNKQTPRGLQVSGPSRTTPRRITSSKAGKPSVRGGAKANLDLMAHQLLRDRNSLGTKLPKLLEPRSPGYHNIADIKCVIGLIDTIALNDTERLRGALGSAYNKCKGALDRWLACLRTIVEFRETTGLEGDGAAISAGFKTLPLVKRKARGPYQEMYQQILTWYKSDGVSIPAFCEEAGAILFQMAIFAPLDMNIDELLGDLTPFTTRLVGCFGIPLPELVGRF